MHSIFSPLPYTQLVSTEEKLNQLYLSIKLADGRGFEPPLGFRPKRTFQARAFNHSATHPSLEKWGDYTLLGTKSQGLILVKDDTY